MSKIALVEGSEEFKQIKKEWYEKMCDIEIATLPDFLSDLIETYQHDYGTICHAITAAAIASARAINNSPQGGITGFQAGAIMWEFIRAWNYENNKTGLRLIDYDKLLYPQYEEYFNPTISRETWEAVQAEAKSRLEEADARYSQYLIDKAKYEEDLATFIAKYPDYHSRREHYDHLDIGTGDEWDLEQKKIDGGFEFAPREPYCPVDSSSPVYRHWKSIVDGIVPFGLFVTE